MYNFGFLRDLVCHMHQNHGELFTFTDSKGKKRRLKPKEQENVYFDMVKHFMHTAVPPGSEGKTSQIIQAFSGTPDLPKITEDVFTREMIMPNMDVGWQQAYKTIPLERGQLTWQILEVDSGFTFELTPESAEAKIYSVSGTSVTAKVEKYSAGIGLTWEMIEEHRLYNFMQLYEALRMKYYTLWANVHYKLLAQAAGFTPGGTSKFGGTFTKLSDGNDKIAYDATGASEEAKDAVTINKGHDTIAKALKDKTYGDTANSQLLLYVRSNMRPRLENVLGRSGHQNHPNFSNSIGMVMPVYSNNDNIPENAGILVLPGYKIQNAVYLREMVKNFEDYKNLNMISTYWTVFGAIIGEAQQVAYLEFATP